MSEAHEDCNCSRGLKGMHVRLSKARSDSFCVFRIHLSICKKLMRVVISAVVLKSYSIAHCFCAMTFTICILLREKLFSLY